LPGLRSQNDALHFNHVIKKASMGTCNNFFMEKTVSGVFYYTIVGVKNFSAPSV
jgi:hypothetical protein